MSNNLGLYKESLNNLTPLEITLRCHSRSIDFIQDAIESLNVNNDKIEFVANLNNAIKILESFMFSLELILPDGSINQPANQSFMLYQFIVKVLREGMINFNIDNFDKCCDFLDELYAAYSKVNL